MRRNLILLSVVFTLLAAWTPHPAFANSHTKPFRATVTDTFVQGATVNQKMPLTIRGRGHADVFGKVTEIGKGTERDSSGGLSEVDTETLTFQDGSSLAVHIVGEQKFAQQMAIVKRRARYTIMGGTGRFAHATGTGKITANCPNDPNSASLTCTNSWNGTVILFRR
jgi:hypothetical protein